ncbi:MAG TPA: glycerol-3-phosphate dehydrogenase/oxidase [Armatimonadota bacterium]|nr:glycerol-3-phosphate dehydrogenase/oxidase [Armatimonadota bacterium]
MSETFDLLVIGGGINGLGIAADAAARGLRVLLAEKGDFGSGTTAASSRLIHGGLRYLQYGEIGLVRESLRERGLLARQRPHLVRPIQLLIPMYRGGPLPPWKVGAGLALYAVLARDPLFPAPRQLTLPEVRAREPGIDPGGLTGGFAYPDGQIEFPERLCIELLRETLDAGGEARNHTRVLRLRAEGRRVTGALLRDELTGREREIESRWTVNAAGPWVDAVNALLPAAPPRLIGGTWGTHLVLPARPEGPGGPLYTPARKDGRPIFLLPWDGRLLVGTTDVPFHGDPDDLRVQDWEREYLLSETNRLFPACAYTPADIQYTTIGVRPLPASRRPAAAVTRRHFLVDHRQHGLEGLVSVVGGKLTTYRSLSREVVDHLTPVRPAPIRPEEPPQPDPLPEGLPESFLPRLGRHGPRYRELLELLRADPTLAAPLHPGSPVLEAEVVHAVRREHARTPEDVARRRLMLLPPSEADLQAIRRICQARGIGLAG